MNEEIKFDDGIVTEHSTKGNRTTITVNNRKYSCFDLVKTEVDNICMHNTHPKVSIEYVDNQSEFNGKPITFHNIQKISLLDAKQEIPVEEVKDNVGTKPISMEGDKGKRIENLALLKVCSNLYGKNEFSGTTLKELFKIVKDLFEEESK